MEIESTNLTKAIFHQLKIVDLPGKVEAAFILCHQQVSQSWPTGDENEEMKD